MNPDFQPNENMGQLVAIINPAAGRSSFYLSTMISEKTFVIHDQVKVTLTERLFSLIDQFVSIAAR